MPSFLAVVRTEGPLNMALSNTMVVVSSYTPENSPPMTPATAMGPFSSAMTSISSPSVRFAPSSVSISSPGFALRTVMCPPFTYL